MHPHRVIDHVRAHQARFEQHPYFAFITDRAIPFAARRATLEDMAFYVLFFGDLNRTLLRDDDSDDPLQQAINAHTREDETHWKWYLADLRNMGVDRTATRTALLTELFSPDTAEVRQLCYRLAALATTPSPADRHALIRGIEAAGEVGFRFFARISDEHRAASGRPLVFFGDRHLEVEGASHTLFAGEAADGPGLVGEHAAALIEAATDDIYPDVDRALAIIDETFAAFTAFVDHLDGRGRAGLEAA